MEQGRAGCARLPRKLHGSIEWLVWYFGKYRFGKFTRHSKNQMTMAYSWLFKLLELSNAFYCHMANQGLRYLLTTVRELCSPFALIKFSL